MKKDNKVTMTKQQAAALYTSATVANLMNEYLTMKFGEEYVKFMEETAKKWIEANRKEQEEARASEAHAVGPDNTADAAE